MSIRRWVANKNSSISNAFKSNLKTRMTGSNFGASDIIEVFSIYAQASTSSLSSSELKRILVEFPISTIISDRAINKIPSSGSVNFYFKLFNAEHSETLARQFTLTVFPVSRSWEEGFGLDHEEGTDITKNNTGVNWINAGSASVWANQGGDYLNELTYSQYFDNGTEDLEINITPLVESWVAGTTLNYGIGVKLTGSQETTNINFYTKKFFSRHSEFFFSKPIIEARWNSATTDDRDKFFISSSLLSSADNIHTIYLYNYVNRQLKNINDVNSGSIYVNVYTSASGGDLVITTPSPVTGGYVSTGIYSASFALNTTSSVVYDHWFSGSVVYHTGSILPVKHLAMDYHLSTRGHISSIRNLKPIYSNNETARLRLFVRERNWNPNIYTVASTNLTGSIIENAYYKLTRVSDNYTIIDYGTGSTNHTKLSYDGNGLWYDFDMSTLETGFAYAFKFVYLVDGLYEQQSETFQFRVE